MLTDLTTTALRAFTKYRLYTVLSVSSLVLGLSVFLLGLIVVENIRSLDRDLTKYDQIYNVYTRWIDFPAVGPINLTTSYFTANELTNHFPQIEHTASITSTGGDDWLVKYGDIRNYERLIVADSDFYNVLDLPMAAGDGAAALADPFSLIVSETMAPKYLGDEQAIGKH